MPGPSLREQPIEPNTLAQGFNVLMQRVAKFDDERPEILIAPRSKEIGAQPANPVFGMRHPPR